MAFAARAASGHPTAAPASSMMTRAVAPARICRNRRAWSVYGTSVDNNPAQRLARLAQLAHRRLLRLARGAGDPPAACVAIDQRQVLAPVVHERVVVVDDRPLLVRERLPS